MYLESIFKKLKPGHLFVATDKFDNELYKAFLGTRLKSKGFNPKQVEFTVLKNVKAPSPLEQLSLFKKLYDEHKDLVDSDLIKYYQEKGGLKNNLKTNRIRENKQTLQTTYMDFINSLEKRSNSQKIFFDELKSNGYDAVYDEHDRIGSWMQAKKPIIIMDAISSLGEMRTKDLNSEALSDALDEWIRLNL